MRRLTFAILLLIAGLVATGCAVEPDDEESDEEVQSSTEQAFSLVSADYKRIPTPAGMPKPWSQPDSRGVLDAQGMCGPTSVSNLLSFYGTKISPEGVYNGGGISPIGTTGGRMEGYLDEKFPQLACDFGNANVFGPLTFLRNQLKIGRPVNVMVGMSGGGAHWVTVVGVTGTDEAPKVRVISWGSYREIEWRKFRDSWDLNYGGVFPYVSCAPRSRYAFPH